jgi:hypothetical protein
MIGLPKQPNTLSSWAIVLRYRLLISANCTSPFREEMLEEKK